MDGGIVQANRKPTTATFIIIMCVVVVFNIILSFCQVLPWKGNLMDNLIGYFLLFVLIINSPLGYPIMFILDLVFHWNLFRKRNQTEITQAELDELEKMIDDFRTR